MAVYYHGAGSRDIGNTMSFLGVPGGHAFHNLFYKNMDSFTDKIHTELQEIVDEGFEKEIKASIQHELKDEYSDEEIEVFVTNYLQDSGFIPDKIKKLPIVASYDMGWNKRSTGRVYDSLSGHAFFIGCRSGKVISFGVKAKKCAKCGRAKRLGINPPPHSCTINHEGSSGSMEAKLALELTKKLHIAKNERAYLKHMVSDDDSTMRSLLQHPCNHNKGLLPLTIPQPVFLADPSHRIKVMSKPFFKMVTTTKDPSKCKMIDALRIKKYLGCFIYKNRTLPLEQFVKKANAPVEHLFNCHEWCDSEWCYAKALTEQTMERVTKVSISI